MATLSGTRIKDSYRGLLKTSDSSPVSSTLKRVQDGSGNDTALQVSTASVKADTLQIDTVAPLSTSTNVLVWDNTTKAVETRVLPTFESVTTSVAGDLSPTITIEDAAGSSTTITLEASNGRSFSRNGNTISLNAGYISINEINATSTLDGEPDESSSEYFVTPSSGMRISLPPAVAGMKYTFNFVAGVSSQWTIISSSGDEFFGKIELHSTSQDASAIQIEQLGNGSGTLTFESDSSHTGGSAGDVVTCIAIDDTSWFVSGSLSTSNSNPSNVATMVAAP